MSREHPTAGPAWPALLAALQARRPAGASLDRVLSEAQKPEDHSLALHLQALLCFHGHDLEGGGKALETASHLERRAGYPESAAHTLHAVALFTNVDGDIRKVRGYYRQSLEQLKRMKNPAGMGLCLRSLGEMALCAGMIDQTRTIWRRCLQYQNASRPAEAGLVRAWTERLDDGSSHQRTES